MRYDFIKYDVPIYDYDMNWVVNSRLIWKHPRMGRPYGSHQKKELKFLRGIKYSSIISKSSKNMR